MISEQFEGIGTHWQIDVLEENVDAGKWTNTLKLVKGRIAEFEKNYSRFRSDSFVNTTLTKPGTHILPSDSGPLIDIYRKLYTITRGAFTPLIGQVLVDAGYDTTYSLKEKTLSTPPSLSEVAEFSENSIHILQPAQFDFGACGKGYLIDIVSDLLKNNGISSFCVDAGGDIRYECVDPLRVGLENPLDVNQAIGVVTISNTSLCASAGSRRKWSSYHHIIDPRILRSPEKVAAIWVLAKDTLTADAIATCLFLEEPVKLTPHFEFEYLILYNDSTFTKSKGFSAELFIK